MFFLVFIIYKSVFCIQLQLCYNFFSSGAIFLAYIIPAYAMAGLREEGGLPAFGIYVGYMLLYLYTVQMIASAMAYACNSRHVAAGLTGLLFTFIALTSGYPCHLNELSSLLSWFHWVSPMKWMKEQLDSWEFSGEDQSVDRYFCARNPLQNEEKIQVKSQCGITRAAHALGYYGNDAGHFNTYVSVLITLAFYLVFHVFAIICFTCMKQSRKKKNAF